jgi:hypothetical protein
VSRFKLAAQTVGEILYVRVARGIEEQLTEFRWHLWQDLNGNFMQLGLRQVKATVSMQLLELASVKTRLKRKR